MIARLRARRNPWAAARNDLAARLDEQARQYEQYGPTEEEERGLARRLIEQMNAERLARRWAHRTVLAFELELREAAISLVGARGETT